MVEDRKSQHAPKPAPRENRWNKTSPMHKIDKARDEIDSLAENYRKKSKTWRNAAKVRDSYKYTTSIQSEAWDKLAAHSKAELTKYLEIMQTLSGIQKELNLLYRELHLSPSESGRLPGPVTEQPEWETWRERLAVKLKDKGLDQKQVDLFLSRLAKTSGKSIVASLQKRLTDQAQTMNSLYFSELRGFSAAHFGIAAAHFNTFTPRKKDTLNTKWLEAIEQDLTKKEEYLWQALRSQDTREIISSANSLTVFSQSNLAEIAEQAALLAAKRKDHPEKTSDDFTAIQTGNLLRLLLQSITLGSYAAWLGNWEPDMKIADDWIKAAKKLPFDVQAKDRFITVNDFLKSRRADDAAVSIAARIKSVAISHMGQNAVSLAELADDSKDGQTLNLTIPYIKLDSTGMVPGASVRLTGKFSSKVKWLNGKSALVLDRLKYTELKKTSWRYWVTAELRSVFDLIPNGLAAEWSWEIGCNGAANPLRYGVWYEKTH